MVYRTLRLLALIIGLVVPFNFLAMDGTSEQPNIPNQEASTDQKNTALQATTQDLDSLLEEVTDAFEKGEKETTTPSEDSKKESSEEATDTPETPDALTTADETSTPSKSPESPTISSAPELESEMPDKDSSTDAPSAEDTKEAPSTKEHPASSKITPELSDPVLSSSPEDPIAPTNSPATVGSDPLEDKDGSADSSSTDHEEKPTGTAAVESDQSAASPAQEHVSDSDIAESSSSEESPTESKDQSKPLVKEENPTHNSAFTPEKPMITEEEVNNILTPKSEEEEEDSENFPEIDTEENVSSPHAKTTCNAVAQPNIQTWHSVMAHQAQAFNSTMITVPIVGCYALMNGQERLQTLVSRKKARAITGSLYAGLVNSLLAHPQNGWAVMASYFTTHCIMNKGLEYLSKTDHAKPLIKCYQKLTRSKKEHTDIVTNFGLWLSYFLIAQAIVCHLN